MPLYQYKRKTCDNIFERYRVIEDRHLVSCPRCASRAVSKLYSPVNVLYRGKGFYSTDKKENG
ncbi:MAG: zinc ribbon domain-containing protein [Candidatus Brocadiales bacterium]|nr:zinc ribbon domain-containing protein [Candidatus Brocadiales bacterium]